MRVQDVMRAEVRKVPPAMPLSELESVLLRARIGGVPVCEGDRVVGIVSRSDVVKHLQVERGEAEAWSSFYLDPYDVDEADELDRQRVIGTVAARLDDATVADVMTREIIAVPPGASLEEAARRMLERRVHRLLVMEGDRLVGIVSGADLIGLFAEGRVAID